MNKIFLSLKGTNPWSRMFVSYRDGNTSQFLMSGFTRRYSVHPFQVQHNAMAQTLFNSYFHIVFSTKNRFDFIQPEIEGELFAYMGGVIKNFDGRLLTANGTSNHDHLLVSMSKNHLVPELIGAVKRESSKWIKTKGEMYSKFAWQDGYSAFSVGYSQNPRGREIHR